MIGVIGPEDSVALVLRVAAEMNIGPQVVARAYEQPDQASALAAEMDAVCQVILFTGRVPYSVAHQAGHLRAVLDFVPHDSTDLYHALVLLLRTYGGHLPVLSIDTIEPSIIAEVWRDLGLEPPTAVLPLTDSPADLMLRGSAEIAAFHSAAWRAKTVQACLTCFRSVYDSLVADGVTVFRVEHTRATVRDALLRALHVADRAVTETQQIAVGLLERLSDVAPGNSMSPPGSRRTDIRTRLARLLHARVQRFDDRTDILFTTWGTLRRVLEQQSGEAEPLASDEVALGFGFGATVPRAEENARRALALGRASRVPHVVFANGAVRCVDDFQRVGRSGLRTHDPELSGRARELGMSGASVQRVFAALQQLDTQGITARDLADALGVGPRSARRILVRLRRYGVVEASGSDAGPGAGRPRTIYRVNAQRVLANDPRWQEALG